MASSAAAAAASGLRHQLSRPSSLLSSCCKRRRRHCPHLSLVAITLSFPATTSHCPIPLARPRFCLPVAGSQRSFSAPASESSHPTRAFPSPRPISLEAEVDDEEEDHESEGEEEVFDVASHDDDDDDESGEEEEGEIDHVGGEDPEFHGKVGRSGLESPAAQGQQPPRPPPPKLSVKERKELAAYAHSLGKKLKCQQVGKSGVTPSVVAAFVETLEANELLKLKVHASCPGELPEVIQQLEESTGSVAVGRIGRSVILYRPSLSKMQKKEKQAVKKTWKPRPKEPTYGLKLQKKKPVQRVSSLRSRNSTTRT